MARRPDRTLPRTPLRDWRERHPEVSWEELARRTGLGTKTVKRAAEGRGVDAESAAALERETGIAAAELQSGKAPPRARKRDVVDRDVKPSKVIGTKTKTKDVRTRAWILVAAELVGDARAAEQFSVGVSTIGRWRAELATDAKLARAYAERLDSGWSRKLQALVEKIAGRSIDLLDAPGLTIDHLRDLAAMLETAAGLLVQRDALVGRARGEDDDDGEGESEAHRDGPSLRADRPGARSVATH